MLILLKKTLSSLVVAIIVLQHATFLVHAAGDFTISNLTINTYNNPSFSGNPGSTFSLNMFTSNNQTEAIQNVYARVNFGNNAGFSYKGIDQRTRIASVSINNPIPSSSYSPATGLTAEVTGAGTPQINPGQSFDMIRATSSAHTGFLIQDNISTYSNNVTFWFEANKVSDNSLVIGDSLTRTIYANVKPHITDYYFEKADGSATTSQVQWDQAEAINLVVKVKDYNGCSNIDGGTVTADLSSLWLSSAEHPAYISCDSDGKTAIFKKNGITTLAAIGDKTFSYSLFTAVDEDGNTTYPNDPNTTFDDEDKKTDLVLTVTPAATPTVTILSTSETSIGGPSKPSTAISFSGSQGIEIKVAAGSDGTCTGGTTLKDWTGSGSYAAYTATGITINASSLVEGTNAIYTCVRNSGGNVGSATVSITKDTAAPTISNQTISPGNVITNDSSTSYRCSENGIYQVEIGGSGSLGGGTFVGSGSTVAAGLNTQAIINSLLVNGPNTVNIFCQDLAGNTVSGSGIVTKTPPTPSMAGQIVSFADNDTDQDGLDGRDMTFSWNSANAVGFSAFESYRIYILPASTVFNSGSLAYTAILNDKNLSTWSGNSSITHDSLGAALVSGASYKACIAIMGTSGQLGTEGCSSAATLTADTVSHPSILSAKFTSDTNLELTTDATLDTTLSNHSGALVSFVRGGSTVFATAVSSVSSTKINLTIPSLGSISATGGTLVVGTGAIRANGGGYNNYFSSGALLIADGQAPTVTAFSKTTPAIFGIYNMGTVNFDYALGEAMAGAGNTKIDFTRTGGNTDGATHTVSLTLASELTAGAHAKSVDLSTLSLVSGTTYRVQLIGKDLAGNTVNSTYITNVAYDNAGPAAPVLTDATNFSLLTPTLNWTITTDDNGNGSGIAKYVLKVYNGGTCNTGSLVQNYDPVTAVSISKTLAALATDPGAYSWNLLAVDNMGNTGSLSTCDAFSVDTSMPTITGQTVLDQTISSSSYGKSTDTAEVSASIAHSDTSHIWADLSALVGSGSYNNVQCSSPGTGVTCTFVGGVAKYTFVVGFGGTVTGGVRQIQFHTQNVSGLNDQTAIASITIDNTPPNVTASAITAPNGGEIWGGTSRNITWNTAAITDADAVSSVRLEYSTGAGLWNLIANTSNAGTYAWDITGLESRNDYTIRITAFDPVGNSASDTSNAVFSIDRTAPTVPSNTLSIPNGGNVYKGGQALSIVWNNGAIVDGGGLAASPITLEYSLNNGANWTQIATWLANNGTYAWTVPPTNATGGLIRITATDNAGNTASDQSDTNFVIDSVNPVQTITYAGGGGNTPQDGRKINNSGLDLTLSATDNYLDTVYYQFVNTSDSLYWNNGTTSWIGVNSWNTLCTDGTALGTNLACGTISTTVNPTILSGKNYALIIRSVDEAGNTTTSITHTYVGDVTAPTLSVATASGSYLSNSLVISGTASDAGSSVSSVKIQIQKGAQYWDGAGWVASATSLLTSTANGYANWNYAFSPPLADNDGQSYTVTMTAYDNAYKVNNSTASTITLTKDASGPAISAGIFTFNTGSLYKGGDVLHITWTPGAITSTGAALAANPITLSYNFTGSIIAIASGLPNNGSYDFTLPITDTSTAKIIVSAVDTIGNVSASVASSNFTIDSLPPSLQSVTTMDQDLDGRIDALYVTLTEPILDSTVTLANFNIGSGIGVPTGFSTGLGPDDASFLLTFSNTGTTATIPTLSYTTGTLTDLAANRLANVSNFASTDAVPPRVTNVGMFDTNANGKMDRITVKFGEDMASTTDATVFTLNNALAGMSIASVVRDAVNHDTFYIALNESVGANTDVGSMTLTMVNDANYKDLANNAAINFSSQSITDQAKPVLVSSHTVDSNANSKVDRIDLQFSEPLLGNVDSEFSLGSLATGSSKGASSIASDILQIAVNETSADNDTSLAPTFTYSGSNLRDSSGNTVSNISARSVSDGVAPKLMSRQTRDLSSNGKVDAIKLTYSESLNSNFAGFNATVAGFTVSGCDSTCGGTNTGSTVMCLTLTENAVADTSVTPAVQVVSNTTLADSASNLALIEGSTTNVIDAVWPVVIGARYDTAGAGVADDTISLTFSENVDGATVSGTSSNDFVLTSGGAFSASSTTAFGGTNSATITMGAGATALTAGTSKISIATAAISDSLGNASPTEGINNRVIVTSPIIINEVMWSGTGSSASQYVELKNIGSSSVNVNGWILSNAGGNGVDLSLPNDTINAGAYYLIAKNTASSSLLNVTPNLVTATLNLNPVSQNNLVLKQGSVIYDTAKANPWPAGNNSLPVSMERRSPAGDGSIAGNWYQAQTSSGFDVGTTAIGTPGSDNVFDATSPVISGFAPANNVLLPSSPTRIAFAYSDAGGSLINTSAATFVLGKWNGTSFADVTGTYVNMAGKTLTQTGAAYPISTPVPFGKYRATFTLFDTAGNSTAQIIDFYVDLATVTVSAGTSNLGVLPVNSLDIGGTEIVITVKTVGAGFSLVHNKVAPMAAGLNSMSDWGGAAGFGFDSDESGAGNTVPYSGTISAVSGGTLANYPKSIDPNGNQKTYVYKIKYGAKITGTQAAGIYSGSNGFSVNWNY